jgi:hypothetical protein
VPSIRPPSPQPPTVAPRPPDSARQAAKAFFQLAAGQAAAPAAAPQAPAPAAAARPATGPNRLAAAPADPPERPLRPGSLLDIRV